MNDYQLIINEHISISPGKVSKVLDIKKKYRNSDGIWVYKSNEKKSESSESNKLKKKFHDFEISVNSQRNLRSKIEYLYYYAKSRTVRTYTKKKIRNFKVCFLTLTLPSVQVHNTATITTLCLDAFLQICRNRLGMKNYVWRMEFQSNGNVHYHILTDTYIDYYFAKKHWNRCVNSLGYVDSYKKKMSNLSYSDYCNLYGKNYRGESISKSVLYQRYSAGTGTNWSNPNTVDVKSIKSAKEISLYVSKYFSKKSKGKKCNALDNEENSYALRLCYWSRSLSRLSLESMPRDYYDTDILFMLESSNNVVKIVYDYCVVYYYDFDKLEEYLKKALGLILEKLRYESEYIPAG